MIACDRGACPCKHEALSACSPTPAGGAVVDTDLLSQCSDLASRVVEAESAKLRADHVHAIEARRALEAACCARACTDWLALLSPFTGRRLSTLLRDLHTGPRISQEHTERATPYMAVKARAELLLGQAVERIKEVRRRCARLGMRVSWERVCVVMCSTALTTPPVTAARRRSSSSHARSSPTPMP